MSRDQEVAPLADRLEFMANKLQNMWGRNPDTDLIREAAEEIRNATTKTKRTTKKEAQQ